MKDGSKVIEEINVADAHPAGKRPFGRKQYIEKFKILTDGLIEKEESNRFLKTVQNLKKIKANKLWMLNLEVKQSFKGRETMKKAIF